MKLVENNEMTDDEIDIAKPFKKYSVDIVKKLEMFKNTIQKNTKEQSAISTNVKIPIAKYRNHLSIIAITEKMEKLGSPTFGFRRNKDHLG